MTGSSTCARKAPGPISLECHWASRESTVNSCVGIPYGSHRTGLLRLLNGFCTTLKELSGYSSKRMNNRLNWHLLDPKRSDCRSKHCPCKPKRESTTCTRRKTAKARQSTYKQMGGVSRSRTRFSPTGPSSALRSSNRRSKTLHRSWESCRNSSRRRPAVNSSSRKIVSNNLKTIWTGWQVV